MDKYTTVTIGYAIPGTPARVGDVCVLPDGSDPIRVVGFDAWRPEFNSVYIVGPDGSTMFPVSRDELVKRRVATPTEAAAFEAP